MVAPTSTNGRRWTQRIGRCSFAILVAITASAAEAPADNQLVQASVAATSGAGRSFITHVTSLNHTIGIDLGKVYLGAREEFTVGVRIPKVDETTRAQLLGISCACLQPVKCEVLPHNADSSLVHMSFVMAYPTFRGPGKISARAAIQNGETEKGGLQISLSYEAGEHLNFDGGAVELLTEADFTVDNRWVANFIVQKGIFSEWEAARPVFPPESLFTGGELTPRPDGAFDLKLMGPSERGRTTIGRATERIGFRFSRGSQELEHHQYRTFSWVVKGPIKASPSQIDFGVVTPGPAPLTKRVRIAPSDPDAGSHVDIRDITFTPRVQLAPGWHLECALDGGSLLVTLKRPADRDDANQGATAVSQHLPVRVFLADGRGFSVTLPINAIIER